MDRFSHIALVFLFTLSYLEKLIPSIVVIVTNLILIITAVTIVTHCQQFTRLATYVDDDERFDEEHRSFSNHYQYIVRMYFRNFFQLETENKYDQEVEQFLAQYLTEPIEDEVFAGTLLVELVDYNNFHLTKLQISTQFIQKSFIRKFPFDKKKPDPSVPEDYLYLVKFYLQRTCPLRNVHLLKIRQLSDSPLSLYRIEIQDTAKEKQALVCHVDNFVQTSIGIYPCIFTTRYNPKPLDMPFNSSKLIWYEITLFVLFGLNLSTIISLTMLEHYRNVSQDISRLLIIQTTSATIFPGFVVAVLVVTYRLCTNYFPKSRRKLQEICNVAMFLVVFTLSALSIGIAYSFSLDNRQHRRMHLWTEAYFASIILYTIIACFLIGLDLLCIHKI